MIVKDMYVFCTNFNIDPKDLEYVITLSPELRYNVFEIRQGRSGKRRLIQEPIPELKKIQQALIPLFERFPFTESCMALKGKSIGHNAEVHKNAKYILRVDIEKCYPSVSGSMIMDAIGVGQHKYTREERSFISHMISISLIRKDDRSWCLPTGAPTSPILCNIALTPLDIDLEKLANNMGYMYSRYIDDLHFSTAKDTRDWGLIQNVESVLHYHNLSPNKRKTKWMTAGHRDQMIITGVSINQEGNRVPRKFRRTVRARLNNLAMLGQSIDQETQGCLAYIKSIDSDRYYSLLDYYHRRLARAINN
jgi:RNA-directed DNA polymerase